MILNVEVLCLQSREMVKTEVFAKANALTYFYSSLKIPKEMKLLRCEALQILATHS